MTGIVSLLILQIIIILLVCKLFNFIFRKIHQPQVIGEMFAGIFLGPSVLGFFAPEISKIIFPAESLSYLYVLGQIGVIIYLFIIGLEVDLSVLRKYVRQSVIIGSAALIVPFILGSMLGFYIHPQLGESADITNFSLFCGTALCVTAFPVLARILSERDLLFSKIGTIAIACAAFGDIIAWILLALVVLFVRASSDSSTSIGFTIGGTTIFILGMLFIAPVIIRRIERFYVDQKDISNNLLAASLLFMLVSAWITEELGIHAIFGAFLAGVIMPKSENFVNAVKQKLEDLTTVLLLPLFFVLTGLKTKIYLINGAEMWLYCILIIVVATAGKFGASFLAARFTGLNWREAGAIGVLMNTKGLMELVVLNVGLEIGIISPSVFAMMVIMTFMTTFITSPLLEKIYINQKH